MKLNALDSVASALLAISLLNASAFAAALPAPASANAAVMKVQMTYLEERNTKEKKEKENSEDSFTLRATAAFERRVLMTYVDGVGATFENAPNSQPSYSGSVTYQGEYKLHGEDERGPYLDENVKSSFAGVLTEDSAVGQPDDNVGAVEVELHAVLKGGCKGARTTTEWVLNNAKAEKKTGTDAISTCYAQGDDGAHAAYLPYAPLDFNFLGRSAEPDAESIRYDPKFKVVECTDNTDYCAQLKAQSGGGLPEAAALSADWIGATKKGDVKQGFNLSLDMTKDVPVGEGVEGSWKRHLQLSVIITPGTKASALEGPSGSGGASDSIALITLESALPRGRFSRLNFRR
jgi:hypothetical protein